MQLLSDTVVHAVQALALLARLQEGTSVPAARIARAGGVPLPSLRRLVLPPLFAAGLLRVRKGAFGGHALARPARDVSLLSVVEAVRGPLRADPLGSDRPGDPLVRRLEAVSAELAGLLRAHLEAVRLDQLAA